MCVKSIFSCCYYGLKVQFYKWQEVDVGVQKKGEQRKRQRAYFRQEVKTVLAQFGKKCFENKVMHQCVILSRKEGKLFS